MSGPASPLASIIIRTLNEAAGLARVLETALGQEGAGTPEIIVIDSGSTDGTLEIVRRFPARLHELPPGEFSFGRALNLGSRLAAAPVCVHLSAHCVPTHRRWLAALLAPLTDPAVVATWGRQVPVRGLNPYEELELERIFPSRPPADGEHRYFSNANCAIRRDVLRARPFDETIASLEDALWLLDLGPGERVVYVPEAEVLHSHSLRLRYWYARYRRDGLAYRYIAARRRIDLLPARSLDPARRVGALGLELARATGALARRGYWLHLLGYPLFCVVRELGLRRGLRRGRQLYPAAPPSSREDAGRSP